MARYLLLAIVAAVLLTDGYLGAVWGGRWQGGREMTAAADRLERLPMQFGDWQGQPQQLDPKVVRIAGFDGYVARRYENQRTGAVVNLLVACGRPGPLAVHTPEVCYAGAGFGLSGDVKRWSPDDAAAGGEFFKATFAPRKAGVPERLRVLWSWNHKGAWKVADNPRWSFAGAPVLYKLYASQEFLPRDEATDGEACAEFLRDFLPEFDRTPAQNH
jgi:hypothetical protein